MNEVNDLIQFFFIGGFWRWLGGLIYMVAFVASLGISLGLITEATKK